MLHIPLSFHSLEKKSKNNKMVQKVNCVKEFVVSTRIQNIDVS